MKLMRISEVYDISDDLENRKREVEMFTITVIRFRRFVMSLVVKGQEWTGLLEVDMHKILIHACKTLHIWKLDAR